MLRFRNMRALRPVTMNPCSIALAHAATKFGRTGLDSASNHRHRERTVTASCWLHVLVTGTVLPKDAVLSGDSTRDIYSCIRLLDQKAPSNSLP